MKFMTLAFIIFALSSMAAHSKVFRFDGQMTVSQKDGDYSKKLDTTLFLDPQKNECTAVIGLNFVSCHVSNYHHDAFHMEITLFTPTFARVIEEAGFESVSKNLTSKAVKLIVSRFGYLNQKSHLKLMTKWQDALLVSFDLSSDDDLRPWETDPRN